MKRIRSLIALSFGILVSCSASSEQVVSYHEFSKQENEVMTATNMTNGYAFDFDFVLNDSLPVLKYYIERYEDGEKIESVEKEFSLGGEKGKATLYFFEKVDHHLIRYHVSLARNGEQATMVEQLSFPGPDLGRSMKTIDKMNLKKNESQILAISTFHDRGSSVPLTEEMFSDEEELSKVLKKDQAIIIKVMLTDQKN
ncbi:hypothetical protein LCM10_18975 [Rossellomorea aquimaris]|uniref:hypothetical protein n=1 Tax=Rossellomorea aquimaris TaxID=189382 RepID=UPI001CD660F8|nr:hypothetical protein [Rossellomorea aquimaris]MCA1057041.1 hypothetical protein [Rossellomorea aquimaris]